ncbi:MAG: hypothetical protein V1790_11755 [Planctomycetota bacterium]
MLPAPPECVAAVRANAQALRSVKTPLLDSTLADWRRRTRVAVVGGDDRPIIVTGHQPAFIHPGVWAKHIMSMRLAHALGGIALNLIVDNDAPQGTTLVVPAAEKSRLALRSVRYAALPAGLAYEQLARLTPEEVARFDRAIRDALGDRYGTSQMPMFIEALADGGNIGDGVDQSVAARRAVEARLGVSVDDRRVSRMWWSPLLLDMLRRAERFSRSYNAALAWYRKKFRVRGHQRPIPDLAVRSMEWELPVWAHRRGEPRRRLFVASRGGSVRLLADREAIGVFAMDDLRAFDELISPLAGPRSWRLRPRALTLTIWARLFLADLFIHGIGGAKYDRISDAIIADYYGLAPPEMACVSATLLLDLPRSSATPETVRSLRRSLRDLEWNSHRSLPRGSKLTEWVDQREQAVRRGTQLRDTDPQNRPARRETFLEIRDLNRRLAAARSNEVADRRAELSRAFDDLDQNRIAEGREYFFGLYHRAALEKLMAALPAEREFRV